MSKMQGNCSGQILYFLDFMHRTGDEPPESWYTYVIYSAEFFVLVLNIALASVLLTLLLSVKVMHHNLTCLYVVFVGVQIPAHLGRMVFMFYEVTDNLEPGGCNVFFIYGTISQLIYIHIVCHSCVSFCTERLFALYHLQDYERRKRPLIPVIIIFLMFISATGFAVDNMFTPSRLKTYSIYVLILVGVTTVLSLLIYKWNKRLLSKIETSPVDCEYSLSKRFQLSENMRVLRLAKYTIASMVILLLIMCGLLLNLVLNGYTPLGVMFFELAKASCPFVVMTTTLLAIEKWRIAVMGWLHIKSTSASVVPSKMDDTQTYFQQLNILWSQTIDQR